MNCPNCLVQFDPVHHIPRLLPHCGHTLCSVCISRLINSNFILCTQCKQLNMAFKQSDLPKNLAILRIQNDSRRNLTPEQPSSSSNTQQSDSTVRSVPQPSHTDQRCGKHGKKLEAFCLECFEYMCLQCVISHPKEHELKTLEEAIGYFKQQTKKIIRFYREMKLNYKMQRIELEKTDVLNTINQYKSRIARIFCDIKTYLQQKETEAIGTLRGLYDVEINRIGVEERELETLLTSYNKLVEISHASSLKACLDQFEENRGLLNYGKQKALFQMMAKRDKTTPPVKGELSHWEESFNKFKDKIAKDIKTMLEIRAELKQKPMGPYKNSSSTSNSNLVKQHSSNNSNTSKKDLQKFYRLDGKKENKDLHISLKELDRFVAPSENHQSRQLPHPQQGSTSATSRVSVETTIVRNPMMMYGGFTEDEDSPAIQIYGQPSSKGSKFIVGSGHVKFGIVGIGSKVYIFGGKRQNKRLSDIYVMDSLRGQMKEFGQMSKAKSGFGYCRKGTCCFVAGGNDGTILQDFEEYDFQSQEVRTLQKLTIARDELTAVLHKNEVYAIGGYNLDNEQFVGIFRLSLNIVEKYNFEHRKWTMLTPLVIQRRSHGSISLDSGLYVVGGYDGRNYLSTIERYNELESRWQIVCEMMEQRCTFGLAENHRNDGFFVFGGFAHQPLATCELFNAETKKCAPVDPLQSRRFMLAAIQVPWDV